MELKSGGCSLGVTNQLGGLGVTPLNDHAQLSGGESTGVRYSWWLLSWGLSGWPRRSIWRGAAHPGWASPRQRDGELYCMVETGIPLARALLLLLPLSSPVCSIAVSDHSVLSALSLRSLGCDLGLIAGPTGPFSSRIKSKD